MKVGIFTYHDINNYGAQLQASSLQKYIESLGHETEVVNYKPFRTRVRIIGSIIRPLLKFDFKRALFEVKKRKMFIESINDILKVSKKSFYTESSVIKYDFSNYDVLICGSDELWNFNEYLGYLKPYIIDFPVAKHVRKISYAASIGNLVPDKVLKDKVKNSLNDFSEILVRDPSTLIFVNDLSFDAKRVLDPTFLYDFKPKKPGIKDYVLVTGSLSRPQVEQAVLLAQELGLAVITPGNQYAGFEDMYVPATTLEWIGYIENASFHFTSLFHGAVFSMKYCTPFAVYRSEVKQQKVNSLMELFYQQKRIVGKDVKSDTLLKISKLEFDSKFHENFKIKIEESKKILINALL